MALTIRALKPRNGFAGEVIGIDLRQSVSDADFETIRDAFHHYAVLVLRDNHSVLHRGNPWPDEEYRRVMHRTTVAGDGLSVQQETAR